jgi:hypothetical protein
MDSAAIESALRAANAAPFQAQRAAGCGRAYCVISIPRKLPDGTRNPDRLKQLKAIEAACKAVGLLFCKETYGVGKVPSIYIGYDNCDGRALGKSEVFARVLKEHGIPCYADAASD